MQSTLRRCCQSIPMGRWSQTGPAFGCSTLPGKVAVPRCEPAIINHMPKTKTKTGKMLMWCSSTSGGNGSPKYRASIVVSPAPEMQPQLPLILGFGEVGKRRCVASISPWRNSSKRRREKSTLSSAILPSDGSSGVHQIWHDIASRLIHAATSTFTCTFTITRRDSISIRDMDRDREPDKPYKMLLRLGAPAGSGSVVVSD